MLNPSASRRPTPLILLLLAIPVLAWPGPVAADTRLAPAAGKSGFGVLIDGPGEVCPASTNSHCGPAGMTSYAWSISGSGAIVGPDDAQCVQVEAGSVRLGDYTLELTFGDGLEGTGVGQRTVAVVDTVAPVITCPRGGRVQCGVPLEWGQATATDDCDPDVKIRYCEMKVAGPCRGDYLIVRTWTATDDAGNMSYCGQKFIITDRRPPEIACPPDRTFEVGEALEFGRPEVSDLCDARVAVTYEDRRLDDQCAPGYTVVRTWTATDDCGNSASCEQRVTVADRTPPEITCPPDGSFGCDEIVEFGQATAVDAVDPDPAITFRDRLIPGDSPQSYDIERTWIAADACGNADSCVQTVRVTDTVGPVLVGAPDGRLICDQPVVFTGPAATDNCDPAPVVTVVSTTAEPGPGECEVSHVRCWDARDAAGNLSNRVCQTIVRYEDTRAPVLTCAPDKEIQPGEPVVFDEPQVTDNCPVGGPELPQVTSALDVAVAQEETTYTRCWVAFDQCGNQSDQCCQAITVAAPAEPPPYCTFVCWNWTAACLEDPYNEEMSTPPACLRDERFSDAFPHGVTVGTHAAPGLFTATWTGPGAVERFKCGYGLPEPLKRDWVDPRSADLGPLAAEILTLRLNREFSCGGYFETYGYPLGQGCFGEFVLPPETIRFAGITVDQFLAVADRAVAGDKAALLPYGYSYFRLHSAAAYLNWLYGECNGFGSREEQAPSLLGGIEGDAGWGDDAGRSQGVPDVFSMTGRPNPARGSVTMTLALPADADVSLDIYDVRGRVVATLLREHKQAGYYSVAWDGTYAHGGRAVPGIYFCRVQIDGRLAAMEKLIKL